MDIYYGRLPVKTMNFAPMSDIHIGHKIKEVLDQSRYSITEFAALINRSRTVAYNIFERDTLDTGLLQQISKVLEHNFFRYLSQDLPVVIQEEKMNYMTQVELLTVLSEEIRAMRKQFADLDKRITAFEKGEKLTDGRKPYKKRPAKK
jgi:hypothetical protein